LLQRAKNLIQRHEEEFDEIENDEGAAMSSNKRRFESREKEHFSADSPNPSSRNQNGKRERNVAAGDAMTGAQSLSDNESILSKNQIESDLSLKDNEFIEKLQDQWKKSQLMKSPGAPQKKIPSSHQNNAPRTRNSGATGSNSSSPHAPSNTTQRRRSSGQSHHHHHRSSPTNSTTTHLSTHSKKSTYPLLHKKQQQIREKMNEIELQAQKISKAIQNSLEKEGDCKRLIHKTSEESKQKQRMHLNDVEEDRQTVDLLQEEIQDAQRKLDFESRQYNDFLRILNERKDQLKRELKALTDELEKDEKHKDAQHDALRDCIEKAQAQLKSLTEREKQLEQQVKDQENVLADLTVREEKGMEAIDSTDYSQMSNTVRDLAQKIDKLQIQETNILLKLETYRQTYPTELEYIEKERHYQVQMQQFAHRKQQLHEQRKQMQQEIDSLQKELRDREEDNESLRADFQHFRNHEEEYIEKHKKRMNNLKTFIQIRIDQVTELQEHVEYLEDVYKRFQEQENSREQLSNMEAAVVQEEEKRFLRSWDKKSKELNSGLQDLIRSYNAEVQNFHKLQINAFADLDMAAVDDDDMEQMQRTIRHLKDYLPSYRATIDIGEQTLQALNDIEEKNKKVNHLKKQKEHLTKAYVNRTMRDGLKSESGADQNALKISSEDEERLATLNRDIVILEHEIRIIQRQMYQFWKNQLNSEQTDINSQKYKVALQLMERMPTADKSTLLLLETSAEVVAVKKKRLSSLMQQIERMDFERMIKGRLLERWKAIHKHKTQDFSQKFQIQQAARRKYIDELKSVVESEVLQLEEAQSMYESSDVDNREDTLKMKADSERQRLLMLSEEISNIEEKINNLHREKKELEDTLTELHEQQSNCDKEYEDNRVEMEQNLAANGELALFEANERIEMLRKLIERLVNIQEIIHRAHERAVELSKDDESVISTLRMMHATRDRIRDLQLEALSAQRSLSRIAQELHNIREEKKELELQFRRLAEKEGKVFQNQVVSIEEKQKQQKQLDEMLQEIDRQEDNSTQNFNNYAIPIREGIEKQEERIAELLVNIQKNKKELQDEKQNLEELHQKYHSQINSLRGQRQHLKHRMDLKTKALDNIQRGTDTRLTPEQNIEANMSSEEKRTYFKQYMKRKMGTIAPSSEFDDSLFDAVLNDQQAEVIQQLSPIHRRSSGLSADANVPAGHPDSRRGAHRGDHESAVNNGGATLKRMLSQSQYTQEAMPPTAEQHEQQEEQHSFEIPAFTLKQDTIRLFGPQSRPLTYDKVAKVIKRIQFMRHGTTLQKKRDLQMSRGKGRYASRLVSLSQELTRLEVKDRRKKVPESFIKVEHIKSVKLVKGTGADEHVFSLVLRDKKVDFMSPDEETCQQWYEGLKMLVTNKHNLFYLQYNLKELYKQQDVVKM